MRASVFIIVCVVLVATCAAQQCTVTSTLDDTIQVSSCDPVTVIPFNQTEQVGGPGMYQLPSTVGCNVVTVNDVVYSVCGEQVSEVACPLGSFSTSAFAAQACAIDAFLACGEDCCEPPAPPPETVCCTKEEDIKVATWANHSWADFVGSDGIPVVPGDSRVQVVDGFLIGTCSTDQGCDIGCLLGEDLVATRDIFIPECNPTVVTVRLVVEDAPPGSTVTLGSQPPVDLVPGEVIITGESGPLNITAPLDTCSEGTPLNISVLELDTHCTATLNRTVMCPPPGKYLCPCVTLLTVSPHGDPINIHHNHLFKTTP